MKVISNWQLPYLKPSSNPKAKLIISNKCNLCREVNQSYPRESALIQLSFIESVQAKSKFIIFKSWIQVES